MFAAKGRQPLSAYRTFVVHGKLFGKFVRILVDTGCNTLMVRTTWLAQHKLLKRTYKPKTSIDVNWGDEGGTYKAGEMVCSDLEMWTSDHKKLSWPSLPFICAPLRVDVILGLPFIFMLQQLHLSEDNGFPTMKFLHDNNRVAISARPTSRK